MSKSEKLRVGIVGAGFMGKTYAACVVKNIPEAELVGVSAVKGAEEIADEYKVKQYERWEDLVNSDQVDVILTPTPQKFHHTIAMAAANAGKHVMVEKPMAITVEECDDIIAACKKNNVKCTVAQTQRHRICNYAAKDLLDSGKLGQIHQIRGLCMSAEAKAGVPPWNLEADQGGLILGHCIHTYDSIRFFTGKEFKSIFAFCRNYMPKDRDGRVLPSDGTVEALAEMSDGSTAYMFNSFEIPKPGFNEQYNFQVYCENGLLDIEAYSRTKMAVKDGQWETIAEQPPIDWKGKGYLDQVRLQSFTRHLSTFFHAILNGTEPPITGWDGRQAVAAVLACYESQRTGKPVELK
ncbi:Gfo/Idh/MocA family oxidoreductase [bacterium]|nr:Gfo/Idh/MocA family oxidoreductase [bacterium]